MKLSKLFNSRKHRKYPIRRDDQGLSLRARCFALFDQEKRPVEIAIELKVKDATVFRYYRDWKKLGPNFERQYAFVKSLFSNTSTERDKNLELFSRACGVSKEQFETILSTPHGLRRFLTGKYYFPIQADADHKRYVALQLALIISDHLINNKGRFEDVYSALKRYMQEFYRYREAEDADIEEENKLMKITHAVLAADMENERKGRVKPDRLSEKERIALIKYGLESEMKQTEMFYWIRIGNLMADGFTQEQAREKMYQDLLDKGDLKVAKAMREFQDKVHPLKTNGQENPTASSPQP
jgi:hypothetical protein